MNLSAKRGSIRREITISADPEKIYNLIGTPNSLPSWFPGIIKAEVDGNIRVITTNSGLELPEEILTNDFIARRFQYRITSPIFLEHLSTIDVVELGNLNSLVIYGVDATPAIMALTIAGAASGALLNLKKIFEGA